VKVVKVKNSSPSVLSGASEVMNTFLVWGCIRGEEPEDEQRGWKYPLNGGSCRLRVSLRCYK